MQSSRSTRDTGFTLVELLIVVATLGILAALLLPVLNKAKARAQRAHCSSNLRQLLIAWNAYFQDNNGRLAETYQTNNPYAWVQGNMKIAAEAEDYSPIRKGTLFPFSRDVGIYHCPTDSGVTTDKPLFHTRSYSINCFMGGRDADLGPIPSTATDYVQFFAKDSDLKRPSELWVLIDEDERSIDDGFFIVDPSGQKWFDVPANSANRHVNTFALAFADGHCATWRNRDFGSAEISTSHETQAGSLLLQRLAAASSVPR